MVGLASLEAMSSTTFQPPTGTMVPPAVAALPVAGPPLAAMAAARPTKTLISVPLMALASLAIDLPLNATTP
jgi:hypothetical protein